MNAAQKIDTAETAAGIVATEDNRDMVQLAQEQRRFHKKVADAEDRLIDIDDTITKARETVRKAEKLEDVQAAVKDWARVDKSRERFIEQRDNYRTMLAGVTQKMQEELNK